MTQYTRRNIFLSLVAVTFVVLTTMMVLALSKNSMLWFEWLLLLAFMTTLPWTAIGFWNAVIGFIVMRTSKDPAVSVYPDLAKVNENGPITTSTAIAMCIRNEDVEQVNRNLTAMMARLTATGYGKHFHVYVLSDSSDDQIVAKEAFVFEKLKRDWAGRINVTYRLRTDNWGYKAGNIRDFCETYGDKHDFMLTLDADSVMSAAAILRVVRAMQANEKLGILQTLVVGLPSDSAFTRVFQFGMRLGMRSFTLGGAWWQGDCGPYWGHNALIRLKPFIEHCHLPQLPGKGPLSGYILSHDQVEAVYMRRAGYECRVLVEEGGSYEENPPHLLEFIRRDLRWCHGNMQYFKVLPEPGLHLTSRIQLLLAIMMFMSAPAWMLFVAVGTGSLIFSEFTFTGFAMDIGFIVFGCVMTMVFAPKIVSVIDILLRSQARKSFGGGFAVVTSAFTEIVFSMILAPILALAATIFIAGLPFGRAKAWEAQNRKAQTLPVLPTVRYLWPMIIFGAVGIGGMLITQSVSLGGFLISLPVFIGPLFVVPFALVTSHVMVGQVITKLGLWRIPEEERPPVIIRALNLSPVAIRTGSIASLEDRRPLTTEELMQEATDADDRLIA